MIRKATSNDLDAIFQLYQQNALDVSRVDDPTYSAQIQKNGFLVALDGKEEMAERIEKNFLFHVFEDGKVSGFINVNKEVYFPKGEDNIIWFNKDLEKSYFHGTDSITLHEIIVDTNFQGKGIGTQLLESIKAPLQEGGYVHLFSIVTFAPVTNTPSLIFHAKQGFERACVTMPFDLFGMKNYMSVLFHKEIR